MKRLFFFGFLALIRVHYKDQIIISDTKTATEATEYDGTKFTWINNKLEQLNSKEKKQRDSILKWKYKHRR